MHILEFMNNLRLESQLHFVLKVHFLMQQFFNQLSEDHFSNSLFFWILFFVDKLQNIFEHLYIRNLIDPTCDDIDPFTQGVSSLVFES